MKKLPKVIITDFKFEGRELVKYQRPVEFFFGEGDRVMCADPAVVDYYGEVADGLPWIDDALTKYAESIGCYWEWQNPECVVLTK